MGALEFRSVPADGAEARDLIAAMVAEVREIYDGTLDLDAPDMPRAVPADFSPPGGAFLIGFRDGVAVCGGGIKRLPDGACEIKRMYVAPDERSAGVARKLLGALEEHARGLGYRVVRLTTGPRQPHARALYLAAGYAEVPNFNGNPIAIFFGEKRLD